MSTKKVVYLSAFSIFMSAALCLGWVERVEPVKRVVLFYVDGLRPDTLDEMAEEGQIPEIKKMFYDEGRRFENCFTIFPSNTVIANGVVMTGQWPQSTGLKTQSFFQRYATQSPGFWKRLLHRSDKYPVQYNLLNDTDVGPAILKRNKIRAFYNYLGEGYHSAVSPLNPYAAPPAWPHVAANYVNNPLKITEEAPEKLDDINAEYAVHYMASDRRARLFMIWFPGIDEDQHHDEWGQFGEMRQRIQKLDASIAHIRRAMEKSNPEDEFYYVLFSDHGAYGGAGGVYNAPFHIGRDFFYQKLKMNVLGPDFTIHHPGTDVNSFVYVDNMGRGQCRLYFPLKDSTSADWSRANNFYELTHYGLGPNRKPLNLLDELMNIDLSERKHFPGQVNPHPVEFAIVKISSNLIYVRKQGGAEALIREVVRGKVSRLLYVPIEGFVQDENGKLHYKKTLERDPFGYLNHPKFHAKDGSRTFIGSAHSDQSWLKASYETDYPDAVSAIARSLFWHSGLSADEGAQDGDIQLSAAPGWNFRVEDVKGADHGSLERPSMRAALMMHGEGIPVGSETKPHRLIELAPTIFKWLGYNERTDFEAPPIESVTHGSVR